MLGKGMTERILSESSVAGRMTGMAEKMAGRGGKDSRKRGSLAALAALGICGCMLTGWQNVDNAWYYFRDDGRCVVSARRKRRGRRENRLRRRPGVWLRRCRRRRVINGKARRIRSV